jgi:phosphoglucomutase
MSSQVIHFGTSGWRGVIAEDFTSAGVRRASAAIADHVLAQNKSPVLLVGYDTGFLSPEFARTSARVLRAHGCGVVLCVEATPTPAIAHAIFDRKLQGGVNITASHNPAQYNGLKFSGPEGGPALPEITKDIERRAAEIKENQPGPGEMADDFEPIGPQAPLARPAKVLEVGRARIDRLRLTFDDAEWVLIRPSGTESLVRIYTESGSASKSQGLAEEARVWITQ